MKSFKTHLFLFSLLLLAAGLAMDATPRSEAISLTSIDGHNGSVSWVMKKAGDVSVTGDRLSLPTVDDDDWLPAIVPGTVLNSLVFNKIYPEPYYGINNRIESGKIPDITSVGNDFYTYWFRTAFNLPESFKGKTVWLQADGINYRAEIWLNGRLVDTTKGMFLQRYVNVTDYIVPGASNGIAIKVHPVDIPGSKEPKSWGAPGEYRNGGNGEIGLNTTMLMSVGWDFTFMDGIRDRNTGIWRDITLYATGPVALRHPFVKSELSKPSYDRASQTIRVDVVNPGHHTVNCVVKGEIEGTGIKFEKKVKVLRGMEVEVSFTPEDFPQLHIDNPKLWWPVNKGPQNLYTLNMQVETDGKISDHLTTRFGIREVTSDCNTPDGSRVFYINGHRLFIRGSNWIPEAMLRTSEERTRAELRYTRQAGINLLRQWGGGIAESDLFYDLCDELGILVWQEFWLTGDTRHPADSYNYLANVESTVKRIRNHPSLAYYVASNESTEVSGTPELIERLDGTRGYQMQSECDGIHDGSPYKQVNPMQHYENTASPRGSRIDGFNPEYGAPTIPTAAVLREMMDSTDLWPMNKDVWDYLDGNGFHLVSSMYTDMVNEYGESKSIDEFAFKAQLVGAMNSKSIWEVWNYNKLDFGDRFCSGLLFWYHNCPVRQVAARMWDWSLEPTASLYHTARSLEPLHPQFDYLKNTVSVVNDYYRAFNDYTVTACVYNIDSKKVWEKSANVNMPADGVANDVITIEFPRNLYQVHFINLTLRDETGRQVASNFYWRSKDRYEGSKSLTGPCVSGFKSLQKMPRAVVSVKCDTEKRGQSTFTTVTLCNSSDKIAFFNMIELTDTEGSPLRPSFYDDNYFTLMPRESRTVTIETENSHIPQDGALLKVCGWNSPSVMLEILPR
ncbi:MAG: hypothetical protein NC082_01020 [Clostridiales bacterium]|nr:hypothetical protein [Clostridiales bacterium]